MINCGHCKRKHKTVVEVRNCYLNTVGLPTINDWSALRPGRYAVDLPAPDEPSGEKLRFFIVTEKRRINEQAGPNIHMVPRQALGPILKAILKAPEESMIRYGRELKVCGKCGLPLTKKESRERGIGPKCGGWG